MINKVGINTPQSRKQKTFSSNVIVKASEKIPRTKFGECVDFFRGFLSKKSVGSEIIRDDYSGRYGQSNWAQLETDDLNPTAKSFLEALVNGQKILKENNVKATFL